jgi:hypothetical protein
MGSTRAPELMRGAEVHRTGPIGRAARVALAAIIGSLVLLRLFTFAHRGPGSYRDPAILGDITLWILTIIVAASVVDFMARFAPGADGVRSGIRAAAAAIALAALATTAAILSFMFNHSIWGFPLADLWWWLNTVYLAQLAVAFGLAAWLRTPGCEQTVWRELAGEQRRDAKYTALTCLVGLHALDQWESDRNSMKSQPSEPSDRRNDSRTQR